MAPPIETIVARLREVFGPEMEGVEPPFMRWRVDGDNPVTGVDLWIHCDPAEPPAPCEIWVTRPDELEPERCEITTMKHLEEFISRVTIVARGPEAEPVAGNVCPS